MSNGVGAPTILTQELTTQIKDLFLAGKQNTEIQQTLEIKPSTWESWHARNTQGFADLMRAWKHQRMIKKAEARIEDLTQSEDERVALEASKFIATTLDKGTYAARIEHTGKDGKDIFPILGGATNEIHGDVGNPQTT